MTRNGIMASLLVLAAGGLATWAWRSSLLQQAAPSSHHQDEDHHHDTPSHERTPNDRSSEKDTSPRLAKGEETLVDTSPEACHAEPLTARHVPIVQVDGPPPEVHGGALRDGVYDLVEYRVFGRPAGTLPETFRQTVILATNGTVSKTIREGRHGTPQTTTWSVEVSENRMTFEGICPEGFRGARETFRFGVSGDRLMTRIEQGGAPVVVTYERRGG